MDRKSRMADPRVGSLSSFFASLGSISPTQISTLLQLADGPKTCLRIAETYGITRRAASSRIEALTKTGLAQSKGEFNGFVTYELTKKGQKITDTLLDP
jgi:DNA-binding MarR family transcriptional regulator